MRGKFHLVWTGGAPQARGHPGSAPVREGPLPRNAVDKWGWGCTVFKDHWFPFALCWLKLEAS